MRASTSADYHCGAAAREASLALFFDFFGSSHNCVFFPCADRCQSGASMCAIVDDVPRFGTSPGGCTNHMFLPIDQRRTAGNTPLLKAAVALSAPAWVVERRSGTAVACLRTNNRPLGPPVTLARAIRNNFPNEAGWTDRIAFARDFASSLVFAAHVADRLCCSSLRVWTWKAVRELRNEEHDAVAVAPPTLSQPLEPLVRSLRPCCGRLGRPAAVADPHHSGSQAARAAPSAALPATL